ncbi:MAG: preprotein translocase subunit SecG [Omnitrophica bacterium RIFCSPHIGHO2_02_FULL_63_14]|nr:MAG: preprotein translocase subunit SecG [Omnitrophica bacterium RIFCSPHIGHO2_02_FULL_63_14]
MYALVLIVHLLVSFILIAVILLQAGRGGGLADFAGAGSSALGTRASTYLTKATTVCAVIFLCTSMILAVLSAQQGRSLMRPLPVKPAAPVAATPVPTSETTPSP